MMPGMSAALHDPMTLADFLTWEERQEERWEFDGIAPVAITGGTFAHEEIGGALRALLREQLRGKPCRVSGPTMKIEVEGRIRYPDAFVSCTPVARGDTIVKNPVVVFEVLSPSTARADRIKKLREYQSTPSIQRYVILEQDSIAAWDIIRRGEDWIIHSLEAGDMLSLPEIDAALPLSDIYADVDLEIEAAQA